jgi:hypothetical protein
LGLVRGAQQHLAHFFLDGRHSEGMAAAGEAEGAIDLGEVGGVGGQRVQRHKWG